MGRVWGLSFGVLEKFGPNSGGPSYFVMGVGFWVRFKRGADGEPFSE